MSIFHENLTNGLYEPGSPVDVSVGHVARDGGVGDEHVFPHRVLERNRRFAPFWDGKALGICRGWSRIGCVNFPDPRDPTGKHHAQMTGGVC